MNIVKKSYVYAFAPLLPHFIFTTHNQWHQRFSPKSAGTGVILILLRLLGGLLALVTVTRQFTRIRLDFIQTMRNRLYPSLSQVFQALLPSPIGTRDRHQTASATVALAVRPCPAVVGGGHRGRQQAASSQHEQVLCKYLRNKWI